MQWCIVRCGGVRQSQWVPAAAATATAGTTIVTAITPTSSTSTLSITIAITIAVSTGACIWASAQNSGVLG